MIAPRAVTVDKARLSILPDNQNPNDRTRHGTNAFQVQFNPASLRISRSNNPDNGKTTHAPKRQHGAPQPATLTFDLEFDTAEIVAGDKLKDVRELTAEVRKFVAPAGSNPADTKSKGKKTDPPPRVLFEWGPLRFPGIVTNLTEEIDYFAPDGTPLHAKLNVTITEQNLEFEANRIGAAAASFNVATKPGQAPRGSTPGTSGTGSPTSLVPANAGESVQQLLTRTGADPAAWRSAMNGLTNPVGLSAGAQVQLDAGISAGAGFSASAGASLGVGAGLGVSAGFSASAEVSAQAALSGALGVSASAGASAGFGGSLSAGASVGASAGIAAGSDASAEVSRIASLGGSVGVTAGGAVGASQQMSAGFVLAAGGGISASTNLVASVRVDASVASARGSFDVPAATVSPSLEPPVVASPSAAAAVIDSRATTYGSSIPLRARATAVTVTGVAAGGPVSVSARAQASEVVVSSSGAPWQRLTADSARAGADAQQRSRDDGPGTMRWTPGR
jgi:hypothetical protein